MQWKLLATVFVMLLFAFMSYGVMNTPAVVINGQLVHSGSIPDKAKVETWLKE